MKKFLKLSLILFALITPYVSYGAVSGRSVSSASRSTGTSTAPTRGVTSARAAAQPNTPGAQQTNKQTNKQTNNTASKPGVAARAAAKQNVVGNGTKVSTKKSNSIVDEQCSEKYNGCMDAMCMTDNISGGRCRCSNTFIQLSKTESELNAQDLETAKIATSGVDILETGITSDMLPGATSKTKPSRSTTDLWNTSNTTDEDDTSSPEIVGDALFDESHNICIERIPECSNDFTMLRQLYRTTIRQDCAAYDNALKQHKTTSNQNKMQAQSALRQAALTQLRDANKYDLGECTIRFRECMTKDAECKNDFTGCVSVPSPTQSSPKRQSIPGSMNSIEVYAATYDILESKRPLCEHVTRECQTVADQVYPTFLREIAPTIRLAEQSAENSARQNCISNVSQCFQKACKDNIDPNDPDGSYDMCLTRPETMLNVCKPSLTRCGVDASSVKSAQKSQIWDYVVARLASMRVDACTNAVKDCLTSNDRCGKDYANCVGLDTDTIIRMCPYEKLTACQQKYGDTDIRDDAVYDELYNMVQGTMLNIDNALYTRCQAALDESMMRVCGDTENCAALTTADNIIGTGSLRYKICTFDMSQENWEIDDRFCWNNVSDIPSLFLGADDGSVTGIKNYVAPMAIVIDGTIMWSNIGTDDSGRLLSVSEYFEKSSTKTSTLTPDQIQRIENELKTIQARVDSIITTIESDPTVQYCMTGRNRPKNITGFGGDQTPRFPQLTKFMRQQITAAAIKNAQDNYYATYDKMNARMAIDNVELQTAIQKNMDEVNKNERREIARVSCLNMAQGSALKETSQAPKSWIGTIIVTAVVVVAAVVVTVYCAPCTAAIATAYNAIGATALTGASTAAATAASVSLSTTAALAGTSTTAVLLGTGGVTAAQAAIGAAVGAFAAANAATTLTVAGVAATVGAAGAAAAGISTGANLITGAVNKGKPTESGEQHELTAKYTSHSWNFESYVTTKFDWESMKCTRCVRNRSCDKIKKPMFGRYSCRQWADPTEPKCEDIQF